MIMAETYLKAKILTHGVCFTESALDYANKVGAKLQNLVYNLPKSANQYRPQELFIRHSDGYRTVVSCVAPCKENPIVIDVKEDNLYAMHNGKKVDDVTIHFVPEPEYYRKNLKNGKSVKRYVSACGYDELNILPWKGCAISQGCLFCGSNVVAGKNLEDFFTAYEISNSDIWERNADCYLENLKEAVSIASRATCYDKHMHVILISGDLSDDKLDYQTEIYCKIASTIDPIVKDKSTEGIIAVMMPPKDKSLIMKLKKSGVAVVVYNLEVSNSKLFHRYCPGKGNIGFKQIEDSLYAAAEIFGKGYSWTNFVLGLEPVQGLLDYNYQLASKGVVSSANVLHLDQGNRIDCDVPDYDTVIHYFNELNFILKEFGYKPFYCAEALRTSLSNEANDGRIKID